MGAFYFYIRSAGCRVMSAAEVGQNIGFVVWQSNYDKLLQEKRDLERKLDKVAKDVKRAVGDKKFEQDGDAYDAIKYGLDLLTSNVLRQQEQLEEWDWFHEDVSRHLYELMKRTGIVDKDKYITTEEEATVYENWDSVDIANVLDKIEQRIVTNDVVVHGEESTTSTNDEKLKRNLHILGLPEDTDIHSNGGWKAVTKAYKKLALKNHPDKGGEEETFKKINEAYHWLENEHSKNLGEYVKSITSNSHARPMDLSTALHIFNTFMQSEAQQERRATGNPYFIKRSI